MSSEPLLHTLGSRASEESLEMTTTKSDEVSKSADGEIGTENDVNEPALADAGAVPSRKQRISDLFTILCAGCALISDGYANSLMTLINVVLEAQYPKQYVSSVSTRVSNALLVGEICGQITIGYAACSCDCLVIS